MPPRSRTSRLRPVMGLTVDTAREALISKVGENVQLRRLVRFDDAQGAIHSYRHGVRICVMVEMVGGDAALGT